MAIPETQLATWSALGANVTSSKCYASVRAALLATNSKIPVQYTDVYLQGSYRNSTNIYGDSDVDIVAQLTSAFRRDLSSLDETQKALEDSAYENVTYGWAEFRNDLLKTLEEYYGNGSVKPSDRCIRVDTGHGRIKADVIPAVTYRKYDYFYTSSVESHKEGISFSNKAGLLISNFPKQHIANGEAKNAAARTNGWYKPSVRIFKNARNRLVDDGVIPRESCPSYFVECLVYNAIDNCFGESCQTTYMKIVDYLWTLAFSRFVSQNEIIPLFGSSPVQWDTDAMTQLLSGLRNLWLNWT